ncbi:MAG: amidohydrolase [Phycisphaerae bacterium]|nr:amidohydrolase [Phycisphaerae bacterium]
MADLITRQIERALPEVVALRHALHAHPELSRGEHETARRVRQMLGGLEGLEVLEPLMETDVVAILNPAREGRCLALRADMDALPVQEQTDVPYKSQVPGVMHACGHEGHVAILVGTAMVLSRMADTLAGRVKFIFQPDEEDGGGGGVLCEQGVLDSPPVDAAVALHGWPAEAEGVISVRPGPCMAANNPFAITVRGRGAHGAYPHRGVDPIVAAAQIIVGLQAIVARNVDPLDSAVATVGHISAGSTTNVIPTECVMTGTLRYLRPETGELLRRRLCEVAEQTAKAHGAQAQVTFDPGYPPMNNDPELTRLIADTAADLFGPQQVRTDDPPTMGVEDFAYYAQRVPAAVFHLGLRPAGVDAYPGLHTPAFDFNDAVLPVGIRMFCEIAKRFLSSANPAG